MILNKTISVLAVFSLLATQSFAQESPQVERPHGPLLIRSYRPATVSPVNLTNSDHLHSLIRAGRLYLTVQDAIALAIENNLDLEVDRYGPLGAEWNLERAQGGGALRGVTNGNSLVNQVTSGLGVLGSEQAAGLALGAATAVSAGSLAASAAASADGSGGVNGDQAGSGGAGPDPGTGQAGFWELANKRRHLAQRLLDILVGRIERGVRLPGHACAR